MAPAMELTTKDSNEEGANATDSITLDLDSVNSLRTVRGGFTKALTDELGITYPYTKGWVRELAKEKRVITVDYYFYLQGLSDKLTESTKKQHRKRGIT